MKNLHKIAQIEEVPDYIRAFVHSWAPNVDYEWNRATKKLYRVRFYTDTSIVEIERILERKAEFTDLETYPEYRNNPGLLPKNLKIT